MNRIKLFSHMDLDGFGCNIVAKSIFGNVDCENLNYDNVNKRIKEFFISGEYKLYDKIYITDISVDEEVANIIDSIIKKEKIKIMLLDHHPTAEWLNKYNWATVDIERNGEKTSGTRMLYDELIDDVEFTTVNKNYLFEFVEMVRKYDTWLWKTKYNDILSKQLNDLFYIYGSNKFVDNVLYNLKSYSIENFIDDNQLLLELEQEKIDRIIKSLEMRLIGEGIKSEFKRKGYTLKNIDELEGCIEYLYNAIEEDKEYSLEQYVSDTINNCPEILTQI